MRGYDPVTIHALTHRSTDNDPVDHNTLQNLAVADPHTQYLQEIGGTLSGALSSLIGAAESDQIIQSWGNIGSPAANNPRFYLMRRPTQHTEIQSYDGTLTRYYLRMFHANYQLDVTATIFTKEGSTVWHAGNDGTGSGLDADLLDGLQSTAFARISAGTYTGDGAAVARQITTGFLVKQVIIMGPKDGTDAGERQYVSLRTADAWEHGGAGVHTLLTSVHLHATNGFVVGDGVETANRNLATYTYVALG